MARRPFRWFIALYATIDLAALLIEMLLATFVPELATAWGTMPPEFKGILKDVAGYYITAQVGVLGVVSIAVSLVSLIGRSESSGIDVQVYYHESLAFEVVASSIALLAVLCVQALWPLQFVAHQLGFGVPTLPMEVPLVVIHTIWLAINLGALAHFVAESFRFLQPGAREVIRERYTANWLLPRELRNRLLRLLYVNLTGELFHSVGTHPMLSFGYELVQAREVEIRRTFGRPTVLHDVWLRPLGWALRRRWTRCAQAQLTVNQRRELAPESIYIVFSPSFDRPFQGDVPSCRRHGGVPFTRLESILVRLSFRFRRAEP